VRTTRLVWLGILTACSDYQFSGREDALPDEAGGSDQTNVGGSENTGANDGSSSNADNGNPSGGVSEGSLGGPSTPGDNVPGDDGPANTGDVTHAGTDVGDDDPWGVDDPNDPGIDGGHFDVDTSHAIAELSHGSTDGHVHEYDDKYDVTGIDAFAFLDGALHPITEDVTDVDTPFVLIVANPDLSPRVRISINTTYDETDATTYASVGGYSHVPVADLVPYSLSGAPGTTQLTSLQLHVYPTAIAVDGLQPTVTGCVRENDPGPDGEWRNGALTVQAVALDPDGTIPTDRTMSSGGVQGVATANLLWEVTLFWHWDGPCFDDPDWATF
jgi:hypothetical protein